MNNHHTCQNPAPAGPGLPPRWTQGNKDAIGTAYSADSRLWFTVAKGINTEIYYPTVDRPQVRDLLYVVTDGESFFLDERHMDTVVDSSRAHALDVQVVNKDPEGRFQIVKQIVSDPHEATLLIHTSFEPAEEWRDRLKLYVICSPHLEVSGWDNNGLVTSACDQKLLVAHKNSTWLALTSSTGLGQASCGYVGVNDGWQDLEDNYQLDQQYDCAREGNIALTGEILLEKGNEFTLALSLGHSYHNAVTTLFQSLSIPFAEHQQDYRKQWERSCNDIADLGKQAGDGGLLYRRSQSVLLAHEDKSYPGALIASLSIPWGQVKRGKAGSGGYHLVWTRDLVHSALGLLATNNLDTPRRALIYLAVSQTPDGAFYQNFWVNGEPHWRGIQLDEVAWPILLAWRLYEMEELKNFDPYPMVKRAASFLIRHGPATPQDRWEEASGYSPATLATNIAALICAAAMMRAHDENHIADFVEAYADFLESHVEQWTVTTEGELVPEITRHYIRITPANPDGPHPNENPDQGTLSIPNRHPDAQQKFPAKNIVDMGFLELVRFGIRKAGDPLIEDSLKVVDATLKVETPNGPVWHRYNHDGYGQQPDGSAFKEWGVGRPWPLLSGERGHYELAAGRDAAPFIHSLEGFASEDGLLPEQVWDQEEQPEYWLVLGGPTGSAMPLAWAHAEYITLLRSAADGQAFNLIPEVAKRYPDGEKGLWEVWKPTRQVQKVRRGWTLRIQRYQPFRLRWSTDQWQSSHDRDAADSGLGIWFTDIALGQEQQDPIEFTFFYPQEESWENQNFVVTVVD